MSVGEVILELIRAVQAAEARWEEPEMAALIEDAVKAIDEAVEAEVVRSLAARDQV